MAVAQDDNTNIFYVAFTLVECETAGGYELFYKTYEGTLLLILTYV